MKRSLIFTLSLPLGSLLLTQWMDNRAQANVSRSHVAKPHKASKSHRRTQRYQHHPEAHIVPQTPQQVADLLNWVPVMSDACNLCGGYFVEPPLVKEFPNPAPIKDVATNIDFSGTGTYAPHGLSIFKKNVVITQPGRIITADTAYIYHDMKTGKLTYARLIGNVHLIESGKLMVGPYGYFNFQTSTARIQEPTVHLAYMGTSSLTVPQKYTASNYLNAWARAKYGTRSHTGVLRMWNGVYTTCNPLDPTWLVKASYIELDKANGVGKAYNAQVQSHHVPLLWAPYYSFPLDHRRKSGFLTPSGGYNNQTGADISFPVYWNMAPNYDMLVTPRYMSKRNVQLSSLFRFLTPNSTGDMYASFLPHDRAFQSFIDANTPPQFKPPPYLVPYTNELKRDSINRGYFSFHDMSHYGDRLQTSYDVNYVTDPYFFHDLGGEHDAINTNQLLNQFNLFYHGQHWDFTTLMQDYQTLHPITERYKPVNDQYTRLPEVDLNGDYPDVFGQVEFDVGVQAVNFLYNSNFYPITLQEPIGQRLHIRPELTRSFDWAAGYIKPQIAIDNTDYTAKQATVPYWNTSPFGMSFPTARPSINAVRDLPIADIDSGLYFDRDFNFRNHGYVQTFEPRLFYLYVPYLNQNKYPYFDTQVLPFSYNQLYATNRFTGYDRIENANQVTMGVSTSVLDGDNASQILKAGIGVIYYFQTPRVRDNYFTSSTTGGAFLPVVNNSFLINKGNFSPIAGELTYTPIPYWSFSSNTSWDTHPSRLDNTGVTALYSRDWNHIALLGYQYAYANGRTPFGYPNSTSLIRTGFSWELTKKWSGLGYWYYNVSQKRPESYFAGLQYDTCCVAVRFIADRSFTGTSPQSTAGHVINQWSNVYFVQLQLKGLGSIERNDPSSILSVLPGFQDPLKANYHIGG